MSRDNEAATNPLAFHTEWGFPPAPGMEPNPCLSGEGQAQELSSLLERPYFQRLVGPWEEVATFPVPADLVGPAQPDEDSR